MEESIYGKRSGFLPGLAITSRDKTNQFRESKLWKQGIVHNISMLSRNQMFKPEVSWWQLLHFFDLNSPNSDRYIELWLNMFISWGGVKLFGSQVSPSKTLPHLGRAMTDIQELKQVPSLSFEEPLLVSLLMRVCRLPFHLLLMFPTSWCSFLIGSRGYGSAWLRWPMAQTLCDELLQPFHPLEIRWDPLVLPC